MIPDLLVWSGIAFALLVLVVVVRGLWRLRRWRRGMTAEERRLRDDPRFAEMWVKQYRPEAASESSSPESSSPESSSPESRQGRSDGEHPERAG